MLPATIAFLHTVHIYRTPNQFNPFERSSHSMMRTPTSFKTAPSATNLNAHKVTWESVIKARARHHEVKLRLAEVAKLQKKSESLQEYMRYENDFLKLIQQDDALRAAIAKMIIKCISKS